MFAGINKLLTDLDENIASHTYDKAISTIHSISSQIHVNKILSSDQNSLLEFFIVVYKHIVILSSDSKNKSLDNCVNSFINHWNAILSSLCPLIFLKLCKQLNDSGLTKNIFLLLSPAIRASAFIDNNSEYLAMIVQILEEVDVDQITTLHVEIWHTLVIILSIEQVDKLIDCYISKNKNEKGVSVLVSKDQSTLIEKVFIYGTMEFVCKFLLSIPKKAQFDVLTISSRITESILVEGGNPELAFDIIPFIVKGEPDEVLQSAFYPFWPLIIEYLQKKESVSALYALQSGYKAKLVKESDLTQFLKLDEKTDLRYRLTSFQISLEMIDCEDIRPKLFSIIHEIALTRGNAMLCCLVDHLPSIFQSLLDYDENYAYDVVNTIMNPIPYDQFLPPFVLRFLNSSAVPNPRDDRFKFNVETVVYKYMNLTINVTSEIRNLMKKIGMKIDMLKVDWFDLPISNSIFLVEDVSPDILLEIVSLDMLHISYIPNILEKLTQICIRDDKKGTFYYNKNTVNTRQIFDLAVSTFLKIVCLLGLDLDKELKSRNQPPFTFGKCFMSDLYINGTVKFLIEPIMSSYLGAFIRSLIHLIGALAPLENEKEKLPTNLILSLLIVSNFFSSFMPDQTLIILSKIKDLIEEQDQTFFKLIESNTINNSSIAFSKIVIEYLIAEKSAEEAIKIAKEKALNAASRDFILAQKLAPYIDQPIPEYRTFLAFEGVEKHAEWVEQCRQHIAKDQWITDPNEGKEKENQNENENETQKDEEENENENEEKVFKLDEDAKDVEKGIDGFLDGSKYSIISFLNFNPKQTKISTFCQSVSLEDIEEFAMQNASDVRLVMGFFYYALCHGYHTPKYKEWIKLLNVNESEISLYTASLFLTSLVGKAKANLHLNIDLDEEEMNEPHTFKFNEFPDELNDFVLNGLKSIGYYVISRQLLTFAFQHETSFRWFFIRSIISLDPDFFIETALIFAEFTSKQQLATVYKPFFEGFKEKSSFGSLISIFMSLTQVYFVPDSSLLVQSRPFPLVHDALYSLKVTLAYPPPIKIEKEIIDSLLNALSRQKFFPVTFFTFFSHSKLTDQQFLVVKNLLTPKTKDASNFFNYLLPSAYFSEMFPPVEQPAAGRDPEAERRRSSVDLDPEELNQIVNFMDKETAIHFSNKPPSFSRAFYRSLMLPFMPILPQKLIVEVKDLLCEVFPAFSYNALNIWSNLNDTDQIRFQKYPVNIVEKFKLISSEVIEIYKSVMNDPSFDKKDEVTNQLILTSLTMQSNVEFSVNVCDALLAEKVDMNEKLHMKEVVNSPQFCCLCVIFNHLKKMSLLNENAKADVKDLLESEERKDLFTDMDQHETIHQIVHNLFKDSSEAKVKWSKKHFFKP